jgi:hypothetical protein
MYMEIHVLADTWVFMYIHDFPCIGFWRALACNRLITARAVYEISCTGHWPGSSYACMYVELSTQVHVHKFCNMDIYGNTCTQFVLVSWYTKMHVHRRQSAEYTKTYVHIWPTSVYMKTYVHMSTHLCTWKIMYRLRSDNQHACHDPTIVGAFYGNYGSCISEWLGQSLLL